MLPASLAAGVRGQDVSDVLAAVLRVTVCPLTVVLEDFSGSPLRLVVLTDGERYLNTAGAIEDECYRLDAPPGTRCRWRQSLLTTQDGMVAASVSLIWLPGRLPAAARRELERAIEPAGKVLERFAMRRHDRRALATSQIDEVTGRDAAVLASAVCVVGGQKVAIAGESVLRDFAESLVSEPVYPGLRPAHPRTPRASRSRPRPAGSAPPRSGPAPAR
jgi:chorismate-pyruvate lyase